jgi:mannan endo-1,4-beta-mannosidase
MLLIGCNQKKETMYEHTPIDKGATEETIKLYKRLFALKNKGIMVGHQETLSYGHDWYKEEGRSDVKDITGDYPAIVGCELGHIELKAEYSLDSVFFTDMRNNIIETNKRGGINTASWHVDNISTGSTSWDCKQDTVVKSILPNGVHHREYQKWMDRLGDFFLSLKDDNGKLIPIVFRMYHEHTGGWFWWGNKQCTPEEYKQLWIMTVEYLRDKKNVHNLIYAYSTATVKTEEEFFERYPGDEYVDILGYDCYAIKNEAKVLEAYKKSMDLNLKIITEYATKTNKIAIVGETGMESIPNATYFTEIVYPIISKYDISWILFWRNAWEADKPNHYYLPFKGHLAADDFVKFTKKENILMNKDIK